ncbi:53f29048-f4b5-4a24-acb2-eae01da412de-CDS [Sclerotinia trifoliorum]|uniref:53f29048-f4b5-4a24-acb2-eae01da412de-CDS n=1 Tax=Sclerotinia trifoliorum TaxID=28548 RepID=A0A8H2VXX6_9HELO|nr:53f29048-f4b5-4a24-acb2-eae01da412de-CDS [Sclerotinia trifoliorum]
MHIKSQTHSQQPQLPNSSTQPSRLHHKHKYTMSSHSNPNLRSSPPKRKMAQNSSDRLSKIPKLKVPTSTPTDPSQPSHSRSRNVPQPISTKDSKQHRHHPHQGFIHPPHDSTLFSPTNMSTTPLNLTQSEAPGVIPPFTSPTIPQPHSQPFSDQDTPSGTEDAAGLGAPPNLASDLEVALMEEVEKNPELADGLRIEDLAERSDGGSNLTPGELGVDIDVDIGQVDEDEITWESDEEEEEEEEEHPNEEKDEEYIDSSNSSASSDSGYDDTTALQNPDMNMDMGPEYDEGYVEGGESYNGVGATDEIDWNDLSNDIDVDPYAGNLKSAKVPGGSDTQMGGGSVDRECDDGDAERDGVEALEPEVDEAVDAYEGIDGVGKRSEDDVWW